MTLCFQAQGEPNQPIPDWLGVEFLDAQSRYSIWVVAWIAQPALALGTLELDGSVAGWIADLHLGFEDVMQVSCREFFGARVARAIALSRFRN